MSAHAASALAGARAPQHWRRALASAAARARTLALRAAWLREGVRPLPRLCGEPLFGDALAASLERLGRHADGDGAAGARRTHPPPALKRARDAAGADASVRAPRPRTAPPFPDLAQRAAFSPATVARRSGTGAADGFAFAEAAHRPVHDDARRADAQRAGDADPAGAAHGAARDGRARLGAIESFARTAPEALLAALFARARGAPVFGPRTNGSNPAPRPDRVSAAPPRPARDRPMVPRPPSHAAVAPHGDALASHGRGPTVPSPLDATRTLRARVLERGAGARGRLRSSAGPDSAIERDWTRSPLGPSAPAHLLSASSAPRGETRAVPRAEPRTVPRAERRARRAEYADERAPAIAGADAPAGTAFEASSRDVSRGRAPVANGPAGAAADPALLAPERPGLLPPFAWPTDAGALRAHAPALPRRLPEQSSAEESDDELDVLSAKLDRILVAQARRHGIDV